MQSAKRAAAVAAAAALTSSQQSEPLARFLQISPDHQGGIAVRIKESEVRVTKPLDETGGLRVSSKHFSLRLSQDVHYQSEVWTHLLTPLDR